MDPNALLMAMALMQQRNSRHQSNEDRKRENMRLEELNSLRRVSDLVRRAWRALHSVIERSRMTKRRPVARRTRRVHLPDYGSP